MNNFTITVNGNKLNDIFINYYINNIRSKILIKALKQNKRINYNLFTDLVIESIKSDYVLLNSSDISPVQNDLYIFLSDEFEKENLSRKQALENDEAVYGVTKFSFESYIDYLKENRIVALRNFLSDSGCFNMNDNILVAYYQEIKDSDQLFKNQDGSYKPYSEVCKKVKYYYEMNLISMYLKGAQTDLKVEFNREELKNFIKKSINKL